MTKSDSPGSTLYWISGRRCFISSGVQMPRFPISTKTPPSRRKLTERPIKSSWPASKKCHLWTEWSNHLLDMNVKSQCLLTPKIWSTFHAQNPTCWFFLEAVNQWISARLFGLMAPQTWQFGFSNGCEKKINSDGFCGFKKINRMSTQSMSCPWPTLGNVPMQIADSHRRNFVMGCILLFKINWRLAEVYPSIV